MFTIGLIDDEVSQLQWMRRVIKTNAPIGFRYEFKSYKLPENDSDVVKYITEQVMNDISAGKLSSLIIDYKLVIKTLKIKGTDIYNMIKEEVPKFPLIMLTEVVEESLKPAFIDADKVYKKRDFYKLESEYSKEKVSNIFDSMSKYLVQRDKLQVTLTELKSSLSSEGTNEEIISKIMDCERQLDEFTPTDLTQIDKIFDVKKIKKVVELIEKANKLLEQES